MRRVLLAVTMLFMATPVFADVIILGSKDSGADRLTVWAATDIGSLGPVIEAYLEGYPNLVVEYHDVQSGDLDKRIRQNEGTIPDIAISSAADLQVRLVNDGFTRTHRPHPEAAIAEWANWRDQAFGIAAEPAVIVYNKQLETLGPLPRTRLDLSAMILKNKELLRGRIATYDIAESGIGYLFAAEDSFYSNTFTTLTQTFGQAQARTFCCSNEMLDLVGKGEMLVGYNILGSYALARRRSGSPIEIVLPQDYTLVLSRVAVLPVAAKRPDLGASFLDFLLSPKAQALVPSLADYQVASYQSDAGFTMHPIVLNPALLVFLDRLKQDRFIQAWRRLIVPERQDR